MAWLDDHPPVRSQLRHPRREALSGVIVVHTAENTPDYVAFDGGAEAVANFIRNRTDAGSYHDLVDSDSAIGLVEYDDEAYHDGTGSNPHSLGLSIATRADVWPFAPPAWREGAVEQAAQRAARMARHVKARTGIVVPARRISRAESEARVAGFISHAERDPGRRTDPGSDFPWESFLSRYAALTGDLTNPSEEDDMALTDTERFWLKELFDRKGDFDTMASRVQQLWDRRALIDSLANLDLADAVDEAEIARLVLAGLDTDTLTDEKVAAIIAAMPEALKQALREGVG